MPWRRLLLPILVALPALAILLGLGTWQLQRLHWKTALLAELSAAQSGPARPLGAEPQPWSRVFASGTFLHSQESLLGLEVRGTVLGANLLTPLSRPDGPPVLVNRGWVPLDRPQSIERPEGPVRVEGYVRPDEPRGLFSAEDDPAARRFYTLDINRIGPALDVRGLAPFALVALAPPGLSPQALPQPARSLPQPPNNHLGYVITWYGLALALLGVFVVWARARLKESAA